MDLEITLFTRKELCNKPAALRKIYQKFSKAKGEEFPCLVFPEEVIVDTMADLLDLKVTKKYDTECLTIEDPFGQYPCMIAHQNYIARENIISYFKEVTNINNWLTVPQLRTLEWFEHLVTTKLHLVTKILQINEREVELGSILRYIHSPIRSFIKYRELTTFMSCCSKILGCSPILSSKSNIQ